MSAEHAPEFVAHLLCPGCGEIVALIPGCIDRDADALCGDCHERGGSLLDPLPWNDYREVLDVPTREVL